MDMITATPIEIDLNGREGIDQRLWRLSSPIHDGDLHDLQFIVTSASILTYRNEPETYVFGAWADGKIRDWLELEGSFRGALDHDRALRGFLEYVNTRNGRPAVANPEA